MAAHGARRAEGKRQNVAVTGLGGKGAMATTCAQRIEAFTVRDRKQVVLSEMQVLDAESLFRSQDTDGAGILCRGSLTEALRAIGLEEKLGDQAFRSTVRLAFDAFSADSHFLSLTEFKQLYYMMGTRFPELLPRRPLLRIWILRARGLPALDINGKSDPFTSVQVIGKDFSRMRTRHVEKTLDPVWNEELDDRFAYEVGDVLEFSVWDHDKGSRNELIGRARLAGSEFHREGGFEGDLRLTDLPKDFRGHSTLRVRVTVTELESKAELLAGLPPGGAPEPPSAKRGSNKAGLRAVAHLALGASGGFGDSAGPVSTPLGVTPVAGAAVPAGGAPE